MTAFTHDADGNLTGDARWTYTWDGENRLTKLNLPPALIQAGLPRQLIEFAYDSQGRRVSKQVTDSVRAGTSAMQAAFFNNTDLSGSPVFLEEWWTLHANWGGSPGPGVFSDNFSVRWTGKIAAPATGTWNIGAVWNQNDDVRIWVGGQLIVDKWSGPDSSGSGAINLEAGVEYPLVLEFRNWGGGAQVQLRWSGPGVADTAVTSMVNSSFPGQTTITTTRNLYDGWNLLAEVNAAGAPVRTYAWGSDLSGSMQGAGGVGGLLFANLGSATHAPAFDGHGNVIAYVGMATGNRSATYEYSAFGETIIADGPMQNAFTFRFSTKFTDDETGLLYYGLRYYSPSLGRWISRDPIHELGFRKISRSLPKIITRRQEAQYVFVLNAPTGTYDLLGLASDSDWDRSQLDDGNRPLYTPGSTSQNADRLVRCILQEQDRRSLPFGLCCKQLCVYKCYVIKYNQESVMVDPEFVYVRPFRLRTKCDGNCRETVFVRDWSSIASETTAASARP